MATEEPKEDPAGNSSSYETVTDEEESAGKSPAREEAPAAKQPPVPPAPSREATRRERSDDEFEREHRRAVRHPSPLHPGATPKSAPRGAPEPYLHEMSKGRKGSGKGKRMLKCRYCWKEITHHESGQAQHTYWSVPCLQWQFQLAGFPKQDCLRLAEELKEERMASYDREGPEAGHVPFPTSPPAVYSEQPARLVPAGRGDKPAEPACPPAGRGEIPSEAAYPLRAEREGRERVRRTNDAPVAREERTEKAPKEKVKKDKRKKSKDRQEDAKVRKRIRKDKKPAHEAAEALPPKAKKKTDKKAVLVVSPSPSPRRSRKKREPSSGDDSSGPEPSKITLVRTGKGTYRAVR